MLKQLVGLIRDNCSIELLHDVFTTPPKTFAAFLSKLEDIIEKEREGLTLLRAAAKNKRATMPYPVKHRNYDKSSSPSKICDR